MERVETIETIRERFVHFVDETRGSSPLYATLSARISEDEKLLKLMQEASPTQRRANLLFAAVHYLLLGAAEHPLKAFYASLDEKPRTPGRDAFEAFRDFCTRWEPDLKEIISTRHTQTNEVRRTGAFLPVLQKLSEHTPLALIEVGASAGLNLLIDHYAIQYGDGPWLSDCKSSVRIRCSLKSETPTAKQGPPRIGFRIGLDSRPLNVASKDDARWLKACIWPEHLERRELLAAAIKAARNYPPMLIKGDAVDGLEGLVDAVPEELPICVFHSATLTYLAVTRRREFASEMDRLAGKRSFYWMSLEGIGVRPFDGEALKTFSESRNEDLVNAGELILGSWANGIRKDKRIALADMHGRWIKWLA